MSSHWKEIQTFLYSRLAGYAIILVAVASCTLSVLFVSAISGRQGLVPESFKAILPLCVDRPECVVEFVQVHHRVMQAPPIWSLGDYSRLFPVHPPVHSCASERVLFLAIGSRSVFDEMQQSWGGEPNVTMVHLETLPGNSTMQAIYQAVGRSQGGYDWYFISEGPVLVLIRHLLDMVHGLDPASPLAIGHVARIHPDDAPLAFAGAGVAISRGAVRLLWGSSAAPCPGHHGLSDTISSCFWERGVFIANHHGMQRNGDVFSRYPKSPKAMRRACRETVCAGGTLVQVRTHWVECRFLLEHDLDNAGVDGNLTFV